MRFRVTIYKIIHSGKYEIPLKMVLVPVGKITTLIRWR